MKKFFIFLIDLYQRTPIHTHGLCRYYPTCSEYSKQSIEKYGFFKGSFLSIKRILRCNPLFKGGYDPIPIKEEK